MIYSHVASALFLASCALVACTARGESPTPASTDFATDGGGISDLPTTDDETPDPTADAGFGADATLLDPSDQGAAFVEMRACAWCHQSSNPKDGILSGQTVPRPSTQVFAANLTPDRATGIGDWTDAEILRAIRTGVDNEGDDLCSPMPHFGEMGDDEGAAIVAYLRSLPPVRRAIPESVCTGTNITAADAGDNAGDAGDVVIADPDAAADADICTMLPPNVAASCHGCIPGRLCHPNGCERLHWCEPITSTCHLRPKSCQADPPS